MLNNSTRHEHDEPYLVAVKGSLKTDEKDRLTLILDVHFLEEACSRKFKFFFEKGKIELRVTEAPGDDIIMDGISYAGDPESLKGIPFLGNVMDKGGMSLLTGSVIDLIHPVVFGREKAADPSDHIPEGTERKNLPEWQVRRQRQTRPGRQTQRIRQNCFEIRTEEEAFLH